MDFSIMKIVASVSLGSPTRNHVLTTMIGDTRTLIMRIGTDDKLPTAIEVIKGLDGRVDAIGVGGVDFQIGRDGELYDLKEGIAMRDAAMITPVVDGRGLKNTHERGVIERLSRHPEIQLEGKRVLMVSAMDRMGMAEALVAAGCDPMFGDIIFALGGTEPMRSLEELLRYAQAAWPDISRKRIGVVYPTGRQQTRDPIPKHAHLYELADIIAGDWLFIRKFLPERLDGKVVITNTVRPSDIQMLRDRGVTWLVTSTPSFGEEVSFGTNVIEALIVALTGLKPGSITTEQYLEAIERFQLRERIERLN